MNSTVKTTFFLLAVIVGGWFIFCSCSGGGSKGRGPTSSGIVSVRADACIRQAVQELVQNYQQETTNKVKIKFVSSDELKVGNPSDSADVYILANDFATSTLIDTMAYDPSLKRTLGYLIPCIIVPQSNPAMVTTLNDVDDSNVRIGMTDSSKDILGQFGLEILRKNRMYDRLADRLIFAATRAGVSRTRGQKRDRNSHRVDRPAHVVTGAQ